MDANDAIVIVSKSDAEAVLKHLSSRIGAYGYASVSDLNDLLGLSSNYKDAQWGWKNLDGAEILPIEEGFTLDLPRPISLP